MTLYKGYECYRNQITKRFYAYPIDSLTTDGKLNASTPTALKQAIDDATDTQQLDPWELPCAV